MTSASTGRPTLTVCRGCCCGTERKSPGADHAGVLSTIDAVAGASANVRVADCLGPCERADVVVVGPSPEGRRRGARPVWVARVGSTRVAEALTEWVRDGGPGIADAPPAVLARAFRQER